MDPVVQNKVILAAAVGGGCMVTTALLVLAILMCRKKIKERNKLRREAEVNSSTPDEFSATDSANRNSQGHTNDISLELNFEGCHSEASGSYMPMGPASLNSSLSADTGYSKSGTQSVGVNTLEPLPFCRPLHFDNEPFHFPSPMANRKHVSQTYSKPSSTVTGSSPALTVFRETLLPANPTVHYSYDGHIRQESDNLHHGLTHKYVLNTCETNQRPSVANIDREDIKVRIYPAYSSNDSLSETLQDYEENQNSLLRAYSRNKKYENLLDHPSDIEFHERPTHSSAATGSHYSTINMEPVVCLNPHAGNQYSITYSTSSSTSYDN